MTNKTNRNSVLGATQPLPLTAPQPSAEKSLVSEESIWVSQTVLSSTLLCLTISRAEKEKAPCLKRTRRLVLHREKQDLLHTAQVRTIASIHFHGFAFLNEERYADFSTGLNLCRLQGVCSGITLQSGLCPDN